MFTYNSEYYKKVLAKVIVLEALRLDYRDVPGGTLVKNPPANTGDVGSIPGPGRSHMPQSD